MATYDENKLTKLAHLKSLAERINKDFATKAELTELENEVDQISENLGDANIIEEIKVNGQAQEVKSKSVDIKVPEKVSDLENDEQFQKASDVKTAVDNAFKEFEEAVTGDDTVNTYKELIEWAASHTSQAAEIVGNVGKNASAIEALKGLVGEDTVSKQISDALEGYVESDELEDYVSDEDLASALEEYVKSEELDDTLDGYVKKDGSKVLSDVNYSATDKAKLDSIEIASDSEVSNMLSEVFSAE